MQKYFGLLLNYIESFCSGKSSKQTKIFDTVKPFSLSTIKKVCYACFSKIPLYSDLLTFSHVHSDQMFNFLLKYLYVFICFKYFRHICLFSLKKIPCLLPFFNLHARVLQLSVIPNLCTKKSSHTYLIISLHSQLASTYIQRHVMGQKGRKK